MDPPCCRSESLKIAGVHSRDHRPTPQIRIGDQEGVDCELGACSGLPEQLPGADTASGVDRVDLNSFTSKPSEDAGVGRTAADALGEHRRDRGDRELTCSHLHDQRPDPIAPSRWSVGDARPYGYSCSGKRPEACPVAGCPHDGTMRLIPSEVEVLREVAERVLLGESLWRIANDLTDRGVPTARGSQRRTNVLTRILTNPRYAGQRGRRAFDPGRLVWHPR